MSAADPGSTPVMYMPSPYSAPPLIIRPRDRPPSMFRFTFRKDRIFRSICFVSKQRLTEQKFGGRIVRIINRSEFNDTFFPWNQHMNSWFVVSLYEPWPSKLNGGLKGRQNPNSNSSVKIFIWLKSKTGQDSFTGLMGTIQALVLRSTRRQKNELNSSELENRYLWWEYRAGWDSECAGLLSSSWGEVAGPGGVPGG